MATAGLCAPEVVLEMVEKLMLSGKNDAPTDRYDLTFV
jgi:hypothetical protein